MSFLEFRFNLLEYDRVLLCLIIKTRATHNEQMNVSIVILLSPKVYQKLGHLVSLCEVLMSVN